MDANAIVKKLGLEKLPEEGGFYKEVYRSKEALPDGSGRVLATDIYYLITPEEFSGLHRVKSSIEIFNFYAGDAAEMIQLTAEGKLSRLTLGPDLDAGQLAKVIVPAGVWQGTRLVPGGKWALVGCTCIPGFEFADFEGGTFESLRERFPGHDADVRRFTHG